VTAEEIRRAVVGALGAVAPEVDPEALDPRANLREQVDIDSIDYLNFLLGIEQVLGVAVPEADYRRVTTLDDCVSYLEARLAGRSPGPSRTG